MKRAFTLIELLFSLMLISSLFLIAMPQIKQNTFNTATINLKDNIYNMYKMQQKIYSKTNSYDEIKKQTLTDSFVTSKKNYTYILKKGYTVETKPVKCNDNGLDGVYIYLKDNNINKTATINSCDYPTKIVLN